MATKATMDQTPWPWGLETQSEWSHESDSNRRPAVYETAALPTELSWPGPDAIPEGSYTQPSTAV